jgi:hypothetical protein
MYFLSIIGYHIPGADADVNPQSAHERLPLPFFEACLIQFMAGYGAVVLAASIAAIRAWLQGRLAPNWSLHFGLVLTCPTAGDEQNTEDQKTDVPRKRPAKVVPYVMDAKYLMVDQPLHDVEDAPANSDG